jgi:glycosidase
VLKFSAVFTFQLTPPLSSRITSRLSSDFVDGLNMIAMLLPGTPITLYGEEIGMADASGIAEHPARCVMSWSNATNAGICQSLINACIRVLLLTANILMLQNFIMVTL